MWEYGEIAVKAVELYTSRVCSTLREAWDKSALAIFPESAGNLVKAISVGQESRSSYTENSLHLRSQK